MATAIAVFGNKGYASSGLSAGIGGTASANDWLVIVVSTYGAGSADDPILTDNISGSAGWVKLVDHFGDSGDGSTDFHATWWGKLCVGGETTVGVAPSSGAPDTAWNGAVLVGPTQPNLYVLDQGEEALVGGRNEFTCTNAPLTNNETYVGLTANGTIPLVSTAMSDPGNTGGAAELLSGAANTVVLFNNNEGANSTAQRPVLFDAASVLLFNYVVVFGITDTTPPALIEGTGHLLISGDVGLEATPGDADVEGTGHLLIGGSVTIETEGGSGPVETDTARLLGGGVARMTAPPPFPPQPITPVMTGLLGCGVYDCFIFTRGLRQIVGRIPFNQLNWSRVLDDTSSAEVTVDGVSNTGPMANCCPLLGSIEPWKHELGVYRNGQRVWSGPITKVSFPSEQVIIDALDLSAWLAIRYLHQDHNFVSPNADLATNWLALVDDAMSVDNSAGLFAIIQALTGVQGERLYTQDMGTLAADAISELARTGLDWSCVDRRMTGGPVAVQPPAYPDATPVPTLVDESFRVAPTVDRDGNLMANSWFVGGLGTGPGGNALVGVYGPEWPGGVDYPDHVQQDAAPDYAAIEAEFGRIERRVNETKVLDQPSIDQNAATRYDLTKLPVDVISSGTLLPSAGIDIRQLTPGSLQNIHLTRACVQIGAPYRLKQLTVTAANDGSEDVEGAWEPVGSVAAHEDLG